MFQRWKSFEERTQDQDENTWKRCFSINKDTVDLRYVEQIADTEQTTALGYALLYAKLHLMDGKKDLCAVADELMQMIETKGLSALLDSKYVKVIWQCLGNRKLWQQ